MKKLLMRAALGALLLTGSALAQAAAAYTPKVLRVGFVPSENLQTILQNSRPIILALHKQLGMQVVPFVATDYTGIIEAMRANRLDVAFFAPGAYVLAEKQAHARVILKAARNGKPFFYTAIITRRDSGIKKLSDLRGKTFAFVDPASTSGGVYPRMMLLNAGINPERDLGRVIYAGGHDAAVLAVFNKKVDAAATFSDDPQGTDSAWTQFLTRPGEAAQIVPIAFSKPVPNDNISVSSGLDAGLVDRVRHVFLNMSATPKGRKLLWNLYRVSAFVPATPADYAPVREAFTKVGLPIK